MSYNKFKKIAQLRDNFGLVDQLITWLPTTVSHKEPSIFLMQSLADAEGEALATEKAKSELIVSPVLRELRRNNLNRFSYFSGYQFDVDAQKKLTGFCDFIFSSLPNRVDIDAPIFCLVEAKKGEIEGGFGQCGAEMYAAQLFNQQKGVPQKVIYGCVTNAFSWAFLKLEGKNLSIDPNYVPLTFTEPQRVLAVLQWILDSCLRN